MAAVMIAIVAKKIVTRHLLTTIILRTVPAIVRVYADRALRARTRFTITHLLLPIGRS